MRLIDADLLLNELSKHSEECQDVYSGLFWMIQNQPTAYDVEKVVDELKALKDKALSEYNIGKYNLDNNIGNKIAENYRQDMNEGKCFAYDIAIEIVKQGGVGTDDVCEWKQEDDNLITSCGDYFNILDNCTEKFDFCPKCGKKIKVVK